MAAELILYYYPTSYYSHRVLIALHEKNLTFTPKIVDITNNEQHQPWFLKLNPKGQVPVLQCGEKIIPDSAAILEFLEEQFTNEMHQSLFLHKEAELEVWEKIDTIRDRINRFANPYLITFGSIYHEQHVRDPLGLFSVPMFRSKMKDRMRLKMESIMENLKTAKSEAEKSFLEDQLRSTQASDADLKNPEKFAEALFNVGLLLDEVETQLNNVDPSGWLTCAQFTVADINLAVLLNRIRNLGLHGILWNGPAPRPNVAAYFERVMQRPSVRLVTQMPK